MIGFNHEKNMGQGSPHIGALTYYMGSLIHFFYINTFAKRNKINIKKLK